MIDIVEEARALLARLNEGAFAFGNAHANQQGERLLASLADECERLQAENARHVDFRASINEALPRPFGVTVLGAIAELRTENALLQAENERLRTENARLREAMPDDAELSAIRSIYDDQRHPGFVTAYIGEWLARLDAARNGGA